MKTIQYLNLVLIFSFGMLQKSAALETSELKSNWKFRRVGQTTWLPATVPGTVHTDLLSNHLIPDPFFGDNESKVQWIDTCEWEYSCSFMPSVEFMSHQEIELVFDGVDTYADIYLNDSMLLSADNMFRSWKIPCKSLLKNRENELRIHFFPASKRGKYLATQLPYTLPGDEKIFTRKAAYHYGWDWGPRFVTCGVWKPVCLVGWDFFRINEVQITQVKLTDTEARLGIHVTVEANDSTHCWIELFNKNTKQDSYHECNLHPGLNNINFVYQVYSPKLWWCHGYGEPYLYNFLINAKNDVYNVLDSVEVNYGIRSLEVVQEKDSVGQSFYFRLNNVPVFMKGANYIPMDNFLPRVSHASMDSLLDDAVNSNMNMLRVWGGGVYESDYFYKRCDEKGILVWQDFMFACAMYPGDEAFKKNVEEEVTQQVRRLRNHPCLALWCGNNEIDEGWHNWEWQKQYHYMANDSAKIWNDYLDLFHKLIPDIISISDPSRFYWESSPSIGWGHDESLRQGDSHYWGVWWGLESFDIYRKKVGRFMSEYGFQGMPSMTTIRSFSNPKDFNTNSSVLKNHQKHPHGFQTINDYLKRDFPEPRKFEEFVYYSQLLQADGIATAIEAHRRAKPRCMGTLYWQLNDCWPVVSWSSRDYYGRWKALQYRVRDSYKTVLVSTVLEKNNLNVYVISDSLGKIDAQLDLKLMDFDSKEIWADKKRIILDSNSSVLVFSIDTVSLLGHADPGKIVMVVRLHSENKELGESLFYFRKLSELQLENPQLSMHVDDQNSKIKIYSKNLVKNLYIEMKSPGAAQLSDNYFDVLPGKEYVIRIPTMPGLHQNKIKSYQTLNRKK